jgi:uncharacterized low-complexity protein
MKIGHTLRTLTLVAAAAMLLMFGLAAAPKAPSAAAPAVFRVAVAQAEEASAAAQAAEGAPAEGEAAAGEAKAEKKEIPHVVGKPSPAQLEDLRRSWDSIPGFDVLLVSILGLVVVVGIVGFGAFKQMKA